ncbi:hypothetical protein AB0B78_10955 [Streptomyces sp. NPDC040724]|uniref:hypothetical protein n=1 Tax=Streptomyces sp. NPDC040724 TaxID=3155612 RepID=UPI0033F0B3F1
MPDDLVVPRPGWSAFEPTDAPDVDTVSQVMQVLGIGAQLSGHQNLVSEQSAPDRSLMAELEVPHVAALGDRRVSPDECDAYVQGRYRGAIAGALTGPLAAAEHREARMVLWRDLDGSEPAGDTRSRQVAAVAFLLAALHSDHEGELLRVAAASELTWQGFPVARRGTRSRQDDADQALMSVLEAGTASDSEDVRVMAGNALARLAEADEALTVAAEVHTGPGPADVQNAQPLGGAGATSGAAESVIIHGTWANNGPTGQWWRPKGNQTFHDFLRKENVGRSLYNRDDCFEWSGNDRNHQRYVAGKALRWWVDRPQGGGRLKAAFAHSHGGTVLMSAAAHQGLQVDLMVALACPDYNWGTNTPEAKNIQANIPLIISIRAKHDAVLLADRMHALKGRRRSAHGLAASTDKLLPGVGHAGVHKVQVWQNEQLAQWVETQAAKAQRSP